MEYPALFDPAEEGGFVVTFPDFDWGITQGDDEEEAREMALDALLTMVQEHIRRGEDLPRAGKPRGRNYRMIRLPALEGMKAQLYAAFRSSGMRRADFARRLGMPVGNLDKLFDFRSRTPLSKLEAAFAALGKRLAVEVQDAA